MSANLILFYSNMCNYSKEVLKRIHNENLTGKFMLVNIDMPNLKIPSFVQAVPLIYDKEDRIIYIDDSIEVFLDRISKNDGSFLSAVDQLNGLTDRFSFIPGHEEHLNSRIYNTFDNKDFNADLRAPVVTSSEGASKFDESQYNSFLSQRDSDIANIFPRQNKMV